uniref:Pimelyl-[acyl-carrier protein] methyl ester esterase n=1 Tax=Lygus hesperus TaxID=30085 RepID=A0A0A9Z7W2_LYGHE
MLRSPPRRCTIEKLLEFRVQSLQKLLARALPLDTAYVKARYLHSLKRSTYAAGLIRQAAAIRRCNGRDAELRRLCLPALVIHGAQDLVVPPMHGYRTAEVLQYARLLVLKNMGHYLHPAFFQLIVAAFADMASATVGKGRTAFHGIVDSSNNGDIVTTITHTPRTNHTTTRQETNTTAS